jgi:hypothetical protein
MLIFLTAHLLQEGQGGIIAGLLVVPFTLFFGAYGAIVAALWMFFPILGICFLLGSLQYFWRPARHWLPWTMMAVSASLVVSCFPEPTLPELRETWAAIGGGISAALMARLIFISSLQISEATAPVTHLVVGSALLGLTIPAAILWRAQYAEEHRFYVRYPSSSSSKPTTDRAPSELTLHEYKWGKRGPYFTTGQSLRFRIPKAYLHDEHLQQGGPQKELRLHAGASNMEPVTDKKADLNLTLAFDFAGFGGQAEREYSDKPESYVGDRCGVWFVSGDFRPERVEIIKRAWPASFITAPAHSDLTGALRFPEQSSATGFSCQAEGKCWVSFRYRGAFGTYWIDRDRFCEWPEQTKQVVSFLDRHLIRETAARSPAEE